MVAKCKSKIVRNCRGRVDDVGHGMIKAFLLTGLSIRDVAKRLNVSVSTVHFIKKAKKSPSQRKHNKPPPPTTDKRQQIRARRKRVVELIRKRTTTTQTEQRVRSSTSRVFVHFPFGSPALVARQLGIEGTTASRTTVRRDLAAAGLKARARPRRPCLFNDDPERRLKFSRRELRDKGAHKRYYFTDEKWFDSDDHGNRYQWCRQGEKSESRGTSQYPKKIHIWGCIGVGVKRLVIHDKPEDEPGFVRYKPGRPKKGEKRPPKNPNAKKSLVDHTVYIKRCLKPTFPKRLTNANKVTFMQDGAGCHTHGESLKFLKSRNVTVLSGWPARSPDINPIETVWAILQRQVGMRGPFTETELKQFVKEEWDKIPQETIDSIVLSYTARLQKCVAVKGETFKP